jgi:hypothetical protein
MGAPICRRLFVADRALLTIGRALAPDKRQAIERRRLRQTIRN